MSEEQQFGWSILELMGHRKLAGYVQEAGPLFRIDVYVDDPDRSPQSAADSPPIPAIATQFYAASALYCITPTTKENCLELARRYQPEPVSRWELPERAGTSEPEDAELAEEWSS